MEFKTYLQQKRSRKKAWKQWQVKINKLVNYCKHRGWTVLFLKNQQESVAYGDLGVIKISSKLKSFEKIYYTLLHELGHMVMIYNHKSYVKKYKRILRGKPQNTITAKMLVVQEEIEAWDTGLKLAKTKGRGWQVNEENFAKTKAKHIMLYCLWAVK